jgi:hypothetical protein
MNLLKEYNFLNINTTLISFFLKNMINLFYNYNNHEYF